MKVSITYCGIWNYISDAERVSAEINERLSGVNIEMIEKDKGIFDVEVDGKLIFSKFWFSELES